MQKGQLTQWTWHLWVVGTITLVQKSQTHAVGMQYAVGMQWVVGTITFSAKSHCTPRSGRSKYTVCSRYL